jgi:glutaredoxin-like protein NrdH
MMHAKGFNPLPNRFFVTQWVQRQPDPRAKRNSTPSLTRKGPKPLFRPLSAPLRPTEDEIKKAGVSYDKIDVTQNAEAREYVMSLGYLATPVVYVSPTQHWSGFRPDRVGRIAAA